ncbi:S-adenosyl-L-methionine-dependent methyltransferase [Byssothecium circinans]|uniref:S-adenosyl-L-methionine-dependent methyltransferase n=1 Tax=Byssothecium circinans TaxID=147558 RepID=A0A6A5TI45_9PLEO|nr:S-adenosyl-L-methionine-dependent methyltransferase [Byssothecium circinans]
MAQTPSLVTLAQQILHAAEEIENSNTTTYPSNPPTSAHKTILSATHTLQTLLHTAPSLLEHHQLKYQTLSALQWLSHFNIFTHVPINQPPIPYTDLAALAAVPLARLRSVARMAMTSGLFHEPVPEHITHSALSAAFATDASLRASTHFITTYSAPMALGMAAASAKWGETTTKNHTAFNAAFNTELPFFDYVKATPGLPELFAGYMRSMGQRPSGRLQHLVDGFDWARLERGAVVVDVGGSTGQACGALAEAFPGLGFVVQDLEEVVAGTAAAAADTRVDEESGADVSARITFVPHDFFTPQPAVATDSGAAPAVYLLRKVLHDWHFDRARQILQHLAVALRDGGDPKARIVVMDIVLPPPGSVDPLQEAILRMGDLTMAQCFNAKERELGEWEELFASTVPPLEIKGWKQPLGSAMAVLEMGIREI